MTEFVVISGKRLNAWLFGGALVLLALLFGTRCVDGYRPYAGVIVREGLQFDVLGHGLTGYYILVRDVRARLIRKRVSSLEFGRLRRGDFVVKKPGLFSPVLVVDSATGVRWADSVEQAARPSP